MVGGGGVGAFVGAGATVAELDAAAAFTTCHVPPKLDSPSPFVSPGALSFENRYSGNAFAVTCVAPAAVVVPSPVTPAAPVAEVVPDGSTSGGQNDAHWPVHATAMPPFVNVYSVMPCASTRIGPSVGEVEIITLVALLFAGATVVDADGCAPGETVAFADDPHAARATTAQHPTTNGAARRIHARAGGRAVDSECSALLPEELGMDTASVEVRMVIATDRPIISRLRMCS